MANFKIIGKKINLRRLKKSDAESIALHAHDKNVNRFTLMPYPYAVNDAIEFIKHTQKIYRKNSGLHFGIEEKESSQIIGVIGLNGISQFHKRAEVGYWLSSRYKGQGIMTDALKLMVRHCFIELKLKRVHAYVDPTNHASINVLEKCGFEKEGLLRKFFRRKNRQTDVFIYSILK